MATFLCPNEDRPNAQPPIPPPWRESAGRCPVLVPLVGALGLACGALVCATCGLCQRGHDPAKIKQADAAETDGDL
jgi:hypothetical protein